MNDSTIVRATDYAAWLRTLKTRLRQVQIKAAISVNQELLRFYWELGAEIIERQEDAQWGSGFLRQLSTNLRAEFPEMKGFSFSNLKYMRQWVRFYTRGFSIGQQPVGQLGDRGPGRPDNAMGQEGQQAVGQIDTRPQPRTLEEIRSLITQIPWGQNLTIITKCENVEEALFYVRRTLAHPSLPRRASSPTSLPSTPTAGRPSRRRPPGSSWPTLV